MDQKSTPVTTAVRFLREHGVWFAPHPYAYEEHGGTGRASRELGVNEHMVIKTLVFHTDAGKALIVLMHGDREVSRKQLARFLQVKTVSPCDTTKAQRLTGYLIGGMSPFGTRVRLPVYVEGTVFDLPRIYINGGKRGFLVEISASELERTLDATRVSVAIDETRGGDLPG